jgi:hypothetical protein
MVFEKCPGILGIREGSLEQFVMRLVQLCHAFHPRRRTTQKTSGPDPGKA